MNRTFARMPCVNAYVFHKMHMRATLLSLRRFQALDLRHCSPYVRELSFDPPHCDAETSSKEIMDSILQSTGRRFKQEEIRWSRNSYKKGKVMLEDLCAQMSESGISGRNRLDACLRAYIRFADTEKILLNGPVLATAWKRAIQTCSSLECISIASDHGPT